MPKSQPTQKATLALLAAWVLATGRGNVDMRAVRVERRRIKMALRSQ